MDEQYKERDKEQAKAQPNEPANEPDNQQQSEQYKVNLPVFAGPMELLLSLIEKHKIDIYDIPMAVVTQEYLDYLARMNEFAIEPASEFLVMAATLLLIKSRMMLPKEPKPSEEAKPEEEADPRRELVERILEYRRYKEVSGELQSIAEQARRFVGRPPMEIPARRVAPTGLKAADLVAAFRLVLAAAEEKELPSVIVPRERFTVEDKMAFITDRLAAEGRLLFTALFQAADREECITTFLALLELIKLERVIVRQAEIFGEILIEKREVPPVSESGENFLP